MIILIIFLLFSSITNYEIKVNATNSSDIYARVINENVYLYRTPTDDSNTNNIYFILPKSYFIKLDDNANSDFYSATYMDIQGFVKKYDVQAISGLPNTPYLENLCFRVYSDQSCKLMSSPTLTSIQIASIPLYNNNLQFIAQIKGETSVLGRTDIWYYCKFLDNNTYGYIYSEFCDGLPVTLPINTEQVTFVPNPTFALTETKVAIPLEDNRLGIIIALLSLPALIFIFMIFKGTKILSKERTKSKEIKEYSP